RLPGLFTGGSLKHRELAGKVALQKVFLALAEVIKYQSQRIDHGLQRFLRIFAHYMHLNDALLVMLLQAPEITLEVAPLALLHIDGHGTAHYRHAVIQNDDLLLMKV